MKLNPGLREQTEEKVLLVVRSKSNGGTRIDWFPSVEEAQAHDMEVLEVRERIQLAKKPEATGFMKLLEMTLGRAASQDRLIHEKTLRQKEYFRR
ncbi:MAG: hypothetical protein SF028_06650 [Candidatus Sumerlaeia bacterium]|nr:hypothetical protein [Candidatus Sumerlaeia bacterium]